MSLRTGCSPSKRGNRRRRRRRSEAAGRLLESRLPEFEEKRMAALIHCFSGRFLLRGGRGNHGGARGGRRFIRGGFKRRRRSSAVVRCLGRKERRAKERGEGAEEASGGSYLLAGGEESRGVRAASWERGGGPWRRAVEHGALGGRGEVRDDEFF